MKLTLSEMSDAQIEAQVAEHVAGYQWWTHPVNNGVAWLLSEELISILGRQRCEAPLPDKRIRSYAPCYLHDSNAVIELLDKQFIWRCERYCKMGPKTVYKFIFVKEGCDVISYGSTFCRAAIVALLRDAGITVEE